MPPSRVVQEAVRRTLALVCSGPGSIVSCGGNVGVGAGGCVAARGWFKQHASWIVSPPGGSDDAQCCHRALSSPAPPHLGRPLNRQAPLQTDCEALLLLLQPPPLFHLGSDSLLPAAKGQGKGWWAGGWWHRKCSPGAAGGAPAMRSYCRQACRQACPPLPLFLLLPLPPLLLLLPPPLLLLPAAWRVNRPVVVGGINRGGWYQRQLAAERRR